MIPWNLESLQIDIYVLPIYLLEKTKRVDQSPAKVKKVATPPFLSIFSNFVQSLGLWTKYFPIKKFFILNGENEADLYKTENSFDLC